MTTIADHAYRTDLTGLTCPEDRPSTAMEIAEPSQGRRKRSGKKPTDRLPHQGEKRSHKAFKGARRAAFTSDVIKGDVDRRALSTEQVRWLQAEWNKAWKIQVSKAGDERTYDTFRGEEIPLATKNHEAGQCFGLSFKNGAVRGHFEVLMATAKLLQGEGGQAIEWHQKDDKDVRRRGKTLNLMRELLLKMMPPPDLSGVTDGEYRLQWGNTFAQNLYKLDMVNLDADQMDYCFRQMKAYLNAGELKKRFNEWIAGKALTMEQLEAMKLAPETDEGRPF